MRSTAAGEHRTGEDGAKRTLVPSPARAMRRIRGGFEGQMQRVENGGQRMERDSRVSHASHATAREPVGLLRFSRRASAAVQ
jgi:hypothetical protein